MKRWPGYRKRLVIVAIIQAILLGGMVSNSIAKNKRTNRYNLLEQLEQPVGIVWSESPLRDSLNHLAESQDVTLWLDRRIDPDRRISLVASDITLKDLLARVAKDQDLSICLFRSVIYLGPSKEAARLRTLGELRRQEAQKLSPRTAKRLFAKKIMRWDDLATPRELLATLAEENQLRIANPQRMVHDLWPGVELPRMALVDRLTLLLVPLGLTFQFEDGGAQIRLVDIPERVVLTRRYPAGSRPRDMVRRWNQLLPDAQITIEGNQIVVEASLDDHERISRNDRPIHHKSPGVKRHDRTDLDRLRIDRVKFKDQPLAAVVRKLAAQLKLKLKFDVDSLRRSGIDVNQLVSLELENVNIDELFRALLKPVGLTFRREGDTLEIRAARP